MSINAAKVAPTLNTQFISHGTLGCHNLEKSRRFYEEFLGLETTQTSPISLMIRLGSNHVYAVVQVKNKIEMPRHYHNGLDVETSEDVDVTIELIGTDIDSELLTYHIISEALMGSLIQDDNLVVFNSHLG